MATSTYYSTNLAADSSGHDNYNYNYDYNYDHDVSKRDEVILSDVIEEIVDNESLYNNNGDDDDVDKLLQQAIMGNTTMMATTTNSMCTKHDNSNNIDMSIGSTMPVDDNVYDANTLDLMREGLPSSLPNVTFDENEITVQGEEAREEEQLPSKWLTEQLGFWYDTSYSSSSSSSLSLSSHSSSSSSSSSLSHSSRSENLSTRRKKSNSKLSNVCANKDTKHKHYWSKQEDEILRFEVNKFVQQDDGNDNNRNINWKEISMCQSFRRARSIPQCKNRWYNHLQQHIKKGKWNKDEDDVIIYMVSQENGFGNWTKIAKEGLPNRTPTQIRDRYVNVLDPHRKKIPWTEEEDRILFEMHRRFGNKWAKFRNDLPGRSPNNIKNRYYNKTKSQQRHMVDTPCSVSVA